MYKNWTDKSKKPKNLKYGLLKIYRFLKNLKNLGFFEAIFQPCKVR